MKKLKETESREPDRIFHGVISPKRKLRIKPTLQELQVVYQIKVICEYYGEDIQARLEASGDPDSPTLLIKIGYHFCEESQPSEMLIADYTDDL